MSESSEKAIPRSAASKLFDLRYLIGGLFSLYGVVLTVVGAFDSDAEITKAAGIAINLWTGIGMLVVGVAFLAWARWRPLQVPEGQTDNVSS